MQPIVGDFGKNKIQFSDLVGYHSYLLKNKKAISCKWVFTVKINPDGSIACLNAHLVANGYAQTQGIG